MHTRRVGGTPATPKGIVIGEEGLFILRYTGPALTEPIYGDITNAEYRFNERSKLYVDKRDAVFLLGPDFEIVE